LGFIDRNLYRVAKATGAATIVGDTTFDGGGDLAFDLNGTLYGGTLDGNLITINPTTDASAVVGSFIGANAPFAYGMDIDSDGVMYAGLGSDSSAVARLYTVNKTTGAATLIGDIAGGAELGLGGLSFAPSQVATVPEPASLLVWSVLGVAGTAGCWWRRRRKR
jgi:hypothetical protein